jgi:hypothetical protein
MICLDSEQSLTNHPIHGISKTTGISSVRHRYREEWTAWHARLRPTEGYLGFPQLQRKFTAPEEILVSENDIRLLEN